MKYTAPIAERVDLEAINVLLTSEEVLECAGEDELPPEFVC